MSKTVFPDRMIPVFQLINGSLVVGEPTPKSEDGKPEKVGDLVKWEVNLGVPYGPRGRYVRPMKVTVLSAAQPDVHDGQIVRFRDLHAGSWKNDRGYGLYFWATRVDVVEHSRGDQ